MKQADRIPSLQVLRFFAALGVAGEHIGLMAFKCHTGGGFGVDVFFVLSGFVISHAAAYKPETFLRDRLARIYPGYWLWGAAWIALAVWQGQALQPGKLFTTLTLIPVPTATVAPGDLPVSGYVYTGWSLSFEMLFYLAIALALRGVRPRLMLAAWAVAMAAAYLVKTPILRFLGSPMVLEFVLGCIAYRTGRRPAWIGAFAVAAGLAIWALLPSALEIAGAAFDPVLGPVRVAGCGPAAFLIVWGAAQLDCTAMGWKPLVALGDASYSLYLCHMLVFMVWVRVFGALDRPFLALALAIGASFAVYIAAERPLTRLARAALRSLPPLRPARAARAMGTT